MSEKKRKSCFNCGQPGHWKNQCDHPPFCYNCRNTGHLGKDCEYFETKNTSIVVNYMYNLIIYSI
jgi:hypothetical protein